MSRDHAVSEVIGTMLIVFLVILLAAVIVSLFLGLIDLTDKSAYIAPAIGKEEISGKTIVSIYNRGGDTAFLNGTGRYSMSVYIDTSSGSSKANPVSTVSAFPPGSTLFVYNSAGGYILTGNSTDLLSPAALSVTACPLTVRLVDETTQNLIARWESDCSSIPVTTVPTPAAPVKAGFTFTPSQGDIPFIVQFTDTSTGPVTTWSWLFHDGATSDLQNPSHTFTSVGWKTVSLTVTNASGGSDTFTCPGGHCPKATANAPVKADFYGIPQSGSKPLTVQFTDTSTGPVNWWRWNFSSGSESTAQNPVKKYSNAGVYTVRLTVRNQTGNDTMTKVNYITVSA